MSTVEPGYDPEFLGPPVFLPRPLLTAPRTVRELPSTHFTVLLDPARRLAAATAVNIDGAKLVDLPRGDDWHLDPRVPPSEQAGPELYQANDLDRGHLVRRRDPVWGPAAALANQQTFAYPNAAPQASAFNQGERLWVGLEDHVLTYASTYRLRLSVFTGPVLADDDPVYRGIGIPRLFWKVASWAVEGTDLRAAGFLLDQTALITNLAFTADAPPLGPFLTYQLPVADIEALTGLDLGQLTAADVLAPVTKAEPQNARWIELTGPADITLD